MRLSKEQKMLVFLGATIGILYSYFTIVIVSKLFNFIFPKEMSIQFILWLFVFPVLVTVGFVISTCGILYRKRWAFKLHLISVAFVLASSIKPLFMFSYYSILGIIGILLFVLSGTDIFFSVKKTTREQFGLIGSPERQKKFRIFNRIFGYSFIILGILVIGFYAVSYFIVYPKQRIFYAAKDNTYLSSHYVKRDIFNVTLFLPKDIQVQSLQKMSLFWNKSYLLSLANSKGTVRMSVNLDPTGELYKYFGYRNSYEFHRRLSRFLHFVSSNLLMFRKEKIIFNDISVGQSLEGFLTVLPSKDKRLIYEYRIYDKNNKGITGNLHFLSAKSDLTYENIGDIIGSLELHPVPPKSAEQFFKEGLALINKSQYEEAKFSLGNALYQDWQDPKYNYYLGIAFFKTNNHSQAKYFLGKSKGYLDVQKLLDQIWKSSHGGNK